MPIDSSSKLTLKKKYTNIVILLLRKIRNIDQLAK